MKHAVNKPFLILLGGVYLENVAMMITWFATISLVMKLSDNPFHIGLITMLETVSLMICSAFAGVMADRFNRKKIIIYSYIAVGCFTSALYFADALWKIYTLTLLNGISFAMYLPAKKALQPTLVKEEHYIDANSFEAMLRNITLIARPPAAAFIVSFFGANGAFLIGGMCAILSAVVILFVRAPGKMQTSASPQKTNVKKDGLQELWQGIRTIRQDASLTYLVVVQMLVTFVFAMQGTLTFIHVEENLNHHGNTETIVGFLFSAVGVGGLLGAIFMRTSLRYISMMKLFLLTLVLDGLLVIVFAFSTNLYLVMAIWAMFGITATMNTIVYETIIQKTVNPRCGDVYMEYSAQSMNRSA